MGAVERAAATEQTLAQAIAERPKLADEPELPGLEDLKTNERFFTTFSTTANTQMEHATIASTAAHVRQICAGLDDLQEQLASSYNMTDEEKQACRLPSDDTGQSLLYAG